MRFKELENAVLFAAGSCWEGVDFPGDMVSSLIIVRLPFAVPDPVREAEKEQYESLAEPYGQKRIPVWCLSWTIGRQREESIMEMSCRRFRSARWQSHWKRWRHLSVTGRVWNIICRKNCCVGLQRCWFCLNYGAVRLRKFVGILRAVCSGLVVLVIALSAWNGYTVYSVRGRK